MELSQTLNELSDKVKVGYPVVDYKSNAWVTLYSIDELSTMGDRLIQSLFEKHHYIAVKHEKTANKPQVQIRLLVTN